MSHKLHSLQLTGCWTSQSAGTYHTQPPRCSSWWGRAVECCSTGQWGSGVLECSSAVQVAGAQELPAWVNLESQVDHFQGPQQSWTMLRQYICTVMVGLVAENMIRTILRSYHLIATSTSR